MNGNEPAPTDEIAKLERMEAALRAVRCLSEGERMELFHNFCLGCGSEEPKCQCWNDE